MKKEVIVILLFVFIAVGSINVYADDLVGCCANPGGGALTCSTDKLALRDKECCPKPESSFSGYYKSAENPNNPDNYQDCVNRFFFSQDIFKKGCSDESVKVCAIGCCCSETGGIPRTEAQCRGTGQTFHKGETNCNQVCPVPQCNDGIDNDNNGCADDKDTACLNPSIKIESGGSCITQGVGCNNANYIPKLSNFQITPVKGQRKFLLSWKDECSETVVSYDVLRCKDAGCTNFQLIGTTSANSFDDSSADLLFDATYTYQIKSRYNLQTAVPTITKTATLGNIECLEQFSSNNFCIHESYYNGIKNYLTTNFPETFLRNFGDGIKNKFGDKFNKAFFCDTSNKLIPEGTSCSPKVCVVSNNKPSCLSKVNCNYNDANPFGLFYTVEGCETDRYCFYDRSHSTIDSCFSCDTSMACYDYKTERACTSDNCRVGKCKWKSLKDDSGKDIGIGVCVSTSDYNCQWCENKGTKTLANLRAFNEVFDFCTEEKSNALSEGEFRCYYKNQKSKNCNDVVCRDYETRQCSSTKILHDENNRITNPSADECGIRVCQNINNACVKNADGNDIADCGNAACESDYFAPNATLLPIIKKGIASGFIVQIYDRTSINNSDTLKTSSDYSTFLCVEPSCANGHPYTSSTTSRAIIISNLNVFDSDNGKKLLSLKDGANAIRYYSQDPAKNIGEVKRISIEAYSNSSGPRLIDGSFNVSDSSKILDKYYTSNQKPAISFQFVEPALITFAQLASKDKTRVVNLLANKNLSSPITKVALQIVEDLPNGEYTFSLNAKNNNNIFMDPMLSAVIVIDNNKPSVDITPSNGTIFNTSLVTIKLAFDKEVNIESIKINSEDAKGSFSSSDNKVFTASLNLQDGNKNLEVSARDYAKNQVIGTTLFIVDVNPVAIILSKPRFGAASSSVFDIAVETDNNAVCKFSLDDNLEFDFMDSFQTTGGTKHTISNFNKIPSGDTRIHKFNVRCDDKSHGISFKSFELNVDTTPPLLKSAFVDPNPIAEKPSITKLTVEADEPVICRYSSNSQDFDKMEGKFEGFDNFTFKVISKQEISVENEGQFLYYVACMNKAELNSETKQIPFKVDLSIPISITSYTPEYFNSTTAVLAIKTNKKSQCKFSESDATAQSGEVFGAPSYGHTRQIVLSMGKHTFFIVCKDQYLQRFSDVASVTFTIDVSPPIILSVNDSSTLSDKPEFTFSTDNLRVKWNSIDNESRVISHLYSLIESGTSSVIINWTTNYINNEWVLVTKSNGTLGIVNGNSYFFRVRAQNIVGLSSNISQSDGITVDTSLKPVNCTNGAKDDKESDIDCGGICSPCQIGGKCSINIDCKTGFCNNGICSAPKCDDNVQNSDETDTDCGGSCRKCQTNKKCDSNNDCESGFCSYKFCKPQEACSDGKLSPTESDVDCGGACPIKCHEGNRCDGDGDCKDSLQCVSSTCKKCADNDKNCNGVPDEQEASGIKDSDKDGIPDEWEIQNGLNPNDANDASLDSDKDGLTNLEEFDVQKTYGKGTNPNLADTDGDGFTDKQEVEARTSPIEPKDFPKSNTGKMILFSLGIIILISGFGYLAYRAVMKRREEKFELPLQRQPLEMQRAAARQETKQFQPKQTEEESKIREKLRSREEEKERERKKLFEVFGKEEAKEEKIVKIVKTKGGEKPKKLPKKPKEDVFSKLKEMSKEEKRKSRSKNAKK